MTSFADISLAILAGGEGTRMGMPKALLEIQGQPILRYLLDRFAWPGPTLLVTAPGHENPPGSERFSREAVDPVAGEGPLRGILTALAASETPRVLIATVDMPEIGMEQLSRLVDALTVHPESVGIMFRRREEDQPVEPFPSIFRSDAARLIEARLATKNRSVHSLVSGGGGGGVVGVVALACPTEWPPGVWTNLNRPEELRMWLGR
jgi:molybdopterin-guanine dinucleotide biosynthesis protein A